MWQFLFHNSEEVTEMVTKHWTVNSGLFALKENLIGFYFIFKLSNVVMSCKSFSTRKRKTQVIFLIFTMTWFFLFCFMNASFVKLAQPLYQTWRNLFPTVQLGQNPHITEACPVSGVFSLSLTINKAELSLGRVSFPGLMSDLAPQEVLTRAVMQTPHWGKVGWAGLGET